MSDQPLKVEVAELLALLCAKELEIHLLKKELAQLKGSAKPAEKVV